MASLFDVICLNDRLLPKMIYLIYTIICQDLNIEYIYDLKEFEKNLRKQ